MKNTFIFFALYFVFHHSLFSQDTLLVGNLFIKGGEVNRKITMRTIDEYELDLDCPLRKRFENLICNCDSFINKNIVNGFTIRSVTKDERQLIIISPNTSLINLESSLLEGVFLINKIPFFLFKLVDLSAFLFPTGKTITLKYYENSNEIDGIILSNLLDERFISEEILSCRHIKLNIVIENCTKTQKIKRIKQN